MGEFISDNPNIQNAIIFADLNFFSFVTPGDILKMFPQLFLIRDKW
jgi:hypothetical protein